MRKFLALPFLLFSLSACDTSEPSGLPRDVLSQDLSKIVAEVPSFGGVAFEAPAAPGQSGVVVYTLGGDAAAEAELRQRLGGLFVDPDTLHVRARPARGGGSEALAGQVAAAVSRPLRVEYDEATGYVRAGFWTVHAARGAAHDMEQAGVPLADVILQVEDRPESE